MTTAYGDTELGRVTTVECAKRTPRNRQSPACKTIGIDDVPPSTECNAACRARGALYPRGRALTPPIYSQFLPNSSPMPSPRTTGMEEAVWATEGHAREGGHPGPERRHPPAFPPLDPGLRRDDIQRETRPPGRLGGRWRSESLFVAVYSAFQAIGRLLLATRWIRCWSLGSSSSTARPEP